MDYVDVNDYLPESHYEYVIDELQCKAENSAKEKALKSLKELHGWCTPNKASLLMDFVYMLKPETVVEIGVFGGSSLVPMAFALKDIGSGVIYGIDPWSSQASAQGMEGVNQDWWANLDHEAIMQSLVVKLEEYDLNTHVQLIRETSESAAEIPYIDMIHIDGNHSEEASFYDVNKWVPLVRKGGIIIFDDMTWGTTDRAVKWLDEHCDKLTEFNESSVWGVWVKP